MSPTSRRLYRLIAGPAFVAVLALSPGATASGSSGPLRLLSVGQDGTLRAEGMMASEGTTTAPRAFVVLHTIDADPYTGYENAVYAADDNTVYVAYKRFTQDPSGGGYVPAELRVAKSADGGTTWTAQVVDANAIESADTLDGSVSIDGDGLSTVYVAYHTRASGLFADMKLKVAKSVDAGATWTITTVVDSEAGDYNSIRRLSDSAVVISAHGAGTEEGIHAYLSTDGGSSWKDSLVEGGLGNCYYTSVGAANPRSIFVSYYNSLFPDHTDLNAARRERVWHTMTVDGAPGDPDLTGLGSSIWVATGPVVWIAYEADTSQGTFVRVAKASVSNPSWTIVPVQQQGGIGVNTAIHAVGTTDVYVSYWAIGSQGQAMFAISSDGGATWAPFAIPELQYVQPYVDSSAPSTSTQFESYQAMNLSTGRTVLRVAVIRP